MGQTDSARAQTSNLVENNDMFLTNHDILMCEDLLSNSRPDEILSQSFSRSNQALDPLPTAGNIPPPHPSPPTAARHQVLEDSVSTEAFSDDSISCFYTNADSLSNKLCELRESVAADETNIPRIIAITEVKPKNSRYKQGHAELHIKNYELFSRNLNSDTGRGVVIYVHDSLQAVELEDSPPGEEAVWLEISLANHNKLLFGCCYRSPGSTDINNVHFNSLVQSMCMATHTHTVICGDFNYPEIDWGSRALVRECAKAAAFLEMVDSTYLHQHVTEPTRSRGLTQANVLDLVFSSEEAMVADMRYEAPLGKSDHCSLRFEIVCFSEPQHDPAARYLYHKGDFARMRAELDIDWKEAFSECPDDPCQQYDIFCTHVLATQESHVPKFDPNKARRHKFPVNHKVRQAIRKKHRAWQRFMETKSANKLQDYNRHRNKVRKLTRQAKLEFERGLASEAKRNPKKFWRYAKQHLKVKEGIPELTTEQRGPDGQPLKATTPLEKADTLAAYFSSVFVTEPPGELPEPRAQVIHTPFQDEPVQAEDVRKLLKQLDPAKAMGPDKIHPRILKELCDVLAAPLAMIYQTSLTSGIVPPSWREANVSAIHKKGSKKEPGNYRPVSLTSVVCKQLEKLIRTRILDHMMNNELLSDSQHGFLPGRSTTTQLLQVVDDWAATLDAGGELDVIYFDFAKAFDTVPHQRLLKKLESYGISASIVNWIRSYLSNRRHRVIVQGAPSDWHDVTSGIPQGSVLGPITFVIYINDLPAAVLSKLLLFADDTKLYRRITSHADRVILQGDVDSMFRWAATWLLNYSPGKCKFMSVSNSGEENPEATYSLGDTELNRVSSEKDIGVVVDSRLRFDEHINAAASKANRVMGVIRRSYTHLDEFTFRLLFVALVRPHLEFSQAAWKPFRRGPINKLEGVQRRASKLVPTLRDLSYPERLKRLRLPTLAFRRLRGDMIETFKITHNIYDPRATQGLLHYTPHTRTRGHPYKLDKPRCTRTLRLNSFTQRITNNWNSLPSCVVMATTTLQFEQRIDAAWRDHPLRWDHEAPELYTHRSGQRGT